MKRTLLTLAIASLMFLSASAAVDDHPIRIIKKPRPTARGCSGPGGSAIARVTFKSDSTIGEVSLVTPSYCQEFNSSVLDVIHQIEFEPEVKDGHAVTVTKQIEYTFAIF